MTIRIEYVITKARSPMEIIDTHAEEIHEIRRYLVGQPFTMLKGLQVTLDGKHLEHVNRYIGGIRTSDMKIVTWTGDDAVFILNNL